MYIATKAFLTRNSWLLIAGQPPSGCDSLPVVEIKSPRRVGIGSNKAYKPDLIAYRSSAFLLVECKPAHSDRDAAKLRTVLGDPDRLALLFAELHQRSIMKKYCDGWTVDRFRGSVLGALAHNGKLREQPDLAVIVVTNINGDGRFFPPGSACSRG